jgi:arginine utilization protein RocB
LLLCAPLLARPQTQPELLAVANLLMESIRLNTANPPGDEGKVGAVPDGYILGRGAIDFQRGLAVFAQALLDIAARKVPLDRDLILLTQADEEGNLYNTGWLDCPE